MLTIDEIKTKAVPVAVKYGVDKLTLFGSYADGNASEKSDADFLIDSGNISDIFVFSGFCDALEKALGLSVDVLTYRQFADSHIAAMPISEVVLYER